MSLTLVVLILIHAASASYIHDDIGVMSIPAINQHRTPNRARLMESTSCAFGNYSVGCNSTNPAGCPCAPFTDDERLQILNAHNFRREQSASGNELCATSDGSSTEPCPAATKMNALIWDTGLEVIATYWAHQFGNGINESMTLMFAMYRASAHCHYIRYFNMYTRSDVRGPITSTKWDN